MARPTSIVTGASRGIGRAIATELASTHDVIGTCAGSALEALVGTGSLDVVPVAQLAVAADILARDRPAHLGGAGANGGDQPGDVAGDGGDLAGDCSHLRGGAGGGCGF